MPVTCIVVGCGSRSNRDRVGFYSVPTVTTHRFLTKKNDLSQKRRALWLAAIKRDDLTETKLKYQKVCSKHFITGKPSALEDENQPDWVPSQLMGHVSQNITHIQDAVKMKERVEIADEVRTKNLHTKKRGKPTKNKFFLNHLQQKNFHLTKDSTVNLSLRHGKFTSGDITLRETSIDNRVLRVFLDRYDFTALRNISPDLKTSHLQKNLKRKRDSSSTTKQTQRSHKKIRINGSSSINNSMLHVPRSQSKITNQILEKSSKKSKDVYKDSKLSTSKTFDKSKFKIRLGSKSTKKKDLKRVTKNSSIINKEVMKKISDRKKSPNMVESATFYLQFTGEKPIPEGKFNYKFQKLISDVKNMTLPSATWKIKVIIKQNKISAITFTNKQELERSVTFSSEAENYGVVIDKKTAHLLGSPETIDSPEDIEILLDIIEHLDSASPVILYR